MDYNKVRLGMIGRLKVWKQRRIDEAQRQQHYKDEGKVLEADYSKAEKLEAVLLEQKRIKKATRDAIRLYKSVYGKNNDDISEADFIENYLVENGLKQKALPEAEKPKKHNFMNQYPTEKSAEELNYEKANQKPDVYYRIGDNIYKTGYLFRDWCFEEINRGNQIPLTTNDGKSYFVQDDKMQPEDKYNMLINLIDFSLIRINQNLAGILDEETSPTSPFSTMCRKASSTKYFAKKLHESGKTEEAILPLERMAEKIFKYNQELLKQEQEDIRE